MKKHLNITLALSILYGSYAFGQQTIQLSQFKENRYIINPAASGVQENWIANMGARRQWVGLGGDPSSIFFGIQRGFRPTVISHEPLALRTSRNEQYHFDQAENVKSKIVHGLSMYAMVDSYGAFRKSSMNVSYALHLPVTKEIKFSAGVNSSFSNLAFDQSKAVLGEGSDNTYDRFVNEHLRSNMLDFNFGSYLYSKDFFVGYSTNQLFGDKINFGGIGNPVLQLHHSIIAGYSFDVNEKITLTPNLYTKTVKGAPLSTDVNLRVDYDKKYFGGLSYRNQDAVVVLLGLNLDKGISLGYSYDFNTSILRKYSGGGHELNLIYNIK